MMQCARYIIKTRVLNCQRTVNNSLTFNELTSVYSCVCPVIDHEFSHNIVKVAVDPRGDSRVDPQIL